MASAIPLFVLRALTSDYHCDESDDLAMTEPAYAGAKKHLRQAEGIRYAALPSSPS
jgi:hypothetical protein